MADMERFDDISMTFNAVDVGSAAEVIKVPVPRAMRLVKSYAVKNATYGAAPVLTVASSKGDLTDTHTIPTGGSENDLSSQDYRPEANNAFAAGSYLTVTVATPSAGDFAGLTLVLRPL